MTLIFFPLLKEISPLSPISMEKPPLYFLRTESPALWSTFFLCLGLAPEQGEILGVFQSSPFFKPFTLYLS